ncbi:polymorphic toxin type 27 domain-containing protein, partial [Streptomyces sp. 12297]
CSRWYSSALLAAASASPAYCRALADAAQAEKDAADAAKLADSAEQHAKSAEAAAANARQYAGEADAAAKRAEEYQREQQRKEREEAGKPQQGDPALDDQVKKALAEAGLSPEQFKEIQALAEKDLIDYLLENGGEILVELFLEDIKACIDDPDIGTCLWAVIQNIGPGKALKLASKMPKIAKAIAGINSFLDKVADARKNLKKYEKALDRLKSAATCLVGGSGGKKSSARRVSAASFAVPAVWSGSGSAKAHQWKPARAASGLPVNDRRTYAVPAGVMAVPAADPGKTEGCFLNDGDHLVLGVNGEGSGDKLAAALKKELGKEYFTLNGGVWGNESSADKNKPLWMVAVEEAAKKKGVKVTFSLDHLTKADGSAFETAEEALRYTVARGRTYNTPQVVRQSGNQTAWELATIVKSSVLDEVRDLKDIDWYWNGKKLDGPPAFDWMKTFSIEN